jgi:histidyl-tRNA synthetase
VRELGGPQTGAVGFAFGIERLLLVRSPELGVRSENLVYVIALGEKAKDRNIQLLHNLRESGICADTDYEAKSLKAAMRKADDLKARFVLIVGDNELEKSVVTVKDMSSGKQEEVAINNIISKLKF